MKSAEDRYRILLGASSAIAGQPTVEAVLHSFRGLLSNSCKLHGAFLYVLDDDGQGLRVYEFDREPDAPAIKVGTRILRVGAMARVLDEQAPVFMPDVSQEMLKHPALVPFASESVGRPTYAFPVSTSKQQYGVLVVTKERGQEFVADDVELLCSMASHVAVALEAALAHEQLKASRDKLQRVEAYLAESQRLSHTASFAFDIASNRYLYISDECFRIFELDAPEYPSREAVSRLIHPDDRDRVQTDFQSVLSEKLDVSSEFRIVLPSGATKYVQAIRHPVLNDAGEVVSVVGSVMDITERKRAEEERRQSAERFRAIADYTYDWENWIGVDGKLLWVNPAVQRITGYSIDECMAMADFPIPIVAETDRQEFARQMKEAVQGTSRNNFEFRVRHKDGHLAWVGASWQPIYDSQGNRLGYRSSIRDIAERKHAEEERRESQAQLAQERDRLALLLEINNHIVTKLEVGELFPAVAVSIRKHLDVDATTFWLVKNGSGHLERRFLDFPTGRGFLAKIVLTEANSLEKEWWRVRRPQIYSPQDLAKLPQSIREAMSAEELVSRVSVPLVGATGPLGLMHLSSRKPNAFSEADVNLLSQIGTQISLALDNALAYGRLRASHDALEEQRLYLESEINSELQFEDLVGNSAAMQQVMKQVAIVARTDSTVLLHGETGTGKELIARAIHRGSLRRDKTFVKLNCAAIPSGLLESELFGHEKGAFTGALMQKKGRFEIADRGTLFLDEIGDISMELQPKLLRAVQEQEFERLGSTRTIQVSVRMIAATHRDIAAMIRNNQFREDLFYRLNVFPIEIPPLRERPGDIPLLVHYFVSRLSRRMQKNIKTIPKTAMEALATFSWPGNVRELENFIERAVILTQGSELNVPIAELRNAARSPRNSSVRLVCTFHDAERQAIIDALKAAAGRVGGETGAAGRLGLKRTTLQNKMRRLNISRAEYLQ